MTLRVDGTFDIECEAWDRFVVGEIYYADGSRFVSWDEDVFYAELRSFQGTLWGHHAGRYDTLWALGMAIEAGDEPHILPRGAGILSLRIGKCILADSAALWPDKLERVADICDSPKHPFPLECVCGRDDCKGYCAIRRRGMSARDKRALADYLHGDCVALYDSLTALIERASDDGFDLRNTIGTTAWRTAKGWCDLPDSPHDLGTYKLIREALQAAMSIVGRPIASKIQRYDIHASYPATLSHLELPCGDALVHESARAARAALTKQRHGVYQCSMHVPDMAYPSLGYRAGDRLLFPTGRIEGAWTLLDIIYAESLGCRVLEVRGGVSWPRTEACLAPYAKRVWKLRATALASGSTSDDAYAAWLKWAANALTGKVSQKETHDVYEYVRGHACADGDPVIRRGPHGHLLAWEGSRVSSCAHVQWGCYLLSGSRIEMHRQVLHAEDLGHFVYGDTDSVYATTKLTRRIGSGLGQWGYEGSGSGWCALAPKLYRYDCGSCKKHPHGGAHVRGKGMPDLTDAGFAALIDGEQWVSERGVLGLRQALASEGPVFQRRRLKRGHNPIEGWIGGRILESDGGTRAPTIAEYEER